MSEALRPTNIERARNWSEFSAEELQEAEAYIRSLPVVDSLMRPIYTKRLQVRDISPETFVAFDHVVQLSSLENFLIALNDYATGYAVNDRFGNYHEIAGPVNFGSADDPNVCEISRREYIREVSADKPAVRAIFDSNRNKIGTRLNGILGYASFVSYMLKDQSANDTYLQEHLAVFAEFEKLAPIVNSTELSQTQKDTIVETFDAYCEWFFRKVLKD